MARVASDVCPSPVQCSGSKYVSNAVENRSGHKLGNPTITQTPNPNMYSRALALACLLSGAAAFHVAPKGARASGTELPATKKANGVLAAGLAGVVSAAAVSPLPPAVANDLVVGTPLETKLAAFGRASYPVFNSVTDLAPLAEKFVEFADATVKADDAAALANDAADGLLAIPDKAVKTYAGVLRKDVFAGVRADSCVELGGSAGALRALEGSASAKAGPAKVDAIRKKFKPANDAVPRKANGNICLPASAAASEKLWVAQASLTLSMPKERAAPLVASIKTAGKQATRPSIAKLVPVAEGVFSKSSEAREMAKAGKDVEPVVISTVKAALK